MIHMQLFLFECKLIVKHKLYVLFCLVLVFLFVLTAWPFSMGKNLEPLDEMHVLVHTCGHAPGRHKRS